jgi:hypothetical protein
MHRKRGYSACRDAASGSQAEVARALCVLRRDVELPSARSAPPRGRAHLETVVVSPVPERLRELDMDGATVEAIPAASGAHPAPVRHVANPNPEEPDAGIPPCPDP